MALALLAPGIAAALGVGDYELNSYLNQPLDMRVELTDTGDLAKDEILVELAGDEDYQRSGAQRTQLHSRLNFEVTLDEDSQSGTLHVTTEKPVREPYLNFLTEVLWPTGRMLREFTVLLDPSSREQQKAQRSEPEKPQREQSTTKKQTGEDTVEKKQVDQGQPVEPTRTSKKSREPVAQESEPTDRSTYKVKKRDTMWQVALDYRPDSSVSVQQMLSAIKRLNKDAFIDGNVNLVREGAVLRIPTQQEIRAINTRNAMEDLASQNRKWREMLRARGIEPDKAPVQGTPSPGADDQQRTGDGEVRLVTEDGESDSDASGSGAGGEGEADSARLENELARREEKLDRLERENKELSNRLDELEEQVDTSDRLLKLREEKIARLQDELGKLSDQQNVDVSDDLMEPVDKAGTGDEQQDAGEEQASVADAEQAGESGEEDSAQDGEGPDMAADTGAGSKPDGDGGAPSGQPGDATGDQAGETDEQAQPTGEESAEAPAAETEPAERAEQQEAASGEPAGQPSLVERILNFVVGNLLWIAVGLVVLVAAVVAAVLALRGRSSEQLPEGPELEADDDDFLPAGLMEDEDEFGFEGDNDEGGGGQEPSGEGQDPLEEADLYVVYGRHQQAVDFLRGEIDKAPDRDDLKIRQLDILGEMQDADAFEQEAARLAGSSAQVDSHIETVRNNLGAGGGEEPSLDDLEMDLSSGLDEGPPAEPAAESTGGGSGEELESLDEFGDFDLSLDEGESGSGGAGSSEESEDFAFDFSGEGETAEDNSLDFEPAGTGGESGGGDELEDLEFSLDDLDTGEDSGGEEVLDVAGSGEAESAPEPAPAESKSDEGDALDTGSVVETDDSFDFDLESLGDDDTEELTLEENVSSEFSEASEEPAADDLDLSLEDLDTGEEQAAAGDDLDTVKTEALDDLETGGEGPAETADDTGMDLDFDATDLGLDDDTQQSPAVEPEAPEPEAPAPEPEAPAPEPEAPAPEPEAPAPEPEAPAPEPEAPAPEPETAGGGEAESMGADELLGEDDDFDFLGDSDENATKLDLAKAYIDMGDNDGARDILNEVLAEGTEGQQGEARELLSQVS